MAFEFSEPILIPNDLTVTQMRYVVVFVLISDSADG